MIFLPPLSPPSKRCVFEVYQTRQAHSIERRTNCLNISNSAQLLRGRLHSSLFLRHVSLSLQLIRPSARLLSRWNLNDEQKRERLGGFKVLLMYVIKCVRREKDVESSLSSPEGSRSSKSSVKTSYCASLAEFIRVCDVEMSGNEEFSTGTASFSLLFNFDSPPTPVSSCSSDSQLFQFHHLSLEWARTTSVLQRRREKK